MLLLKKNIIGCLLQNIYIYIYISFCHEAKENVKYFISAWFLDHGLLVKNDQQWKTFRFVYNMTIFRKTFHYIPIKTS